jgi:hypothetical protein
MKADWGGLVGKLAVAEDDNFCAQEALPVPHPHHHFGPRTRKRKRRSRCTLLTRLCSDEGGGGEYSMHWIWVQQVGVCCPW